MKYDSCMCTRFVYYVNPAKKSFLAASEDGVRISVTREKKSFMLFIALLRPDEARSVASRTYK